MAAKAKAKYLRLSSRKGKLISDMIRGKPVEEALNILRFTPKKAAREIEKVVKSAVANADQDPAMNVDNLVVKRIFVDQGPTMRRFMARAMGRASRIRKRTCHVTVILDEE